MFSYLSAAVASLSSTKIGRVERFRSESTRRHSSAIEGGEGEG